MGKALVCVCALGLFFSSCGENAQDEATSRSQLQKLYVAGYNVTELSYRLGTDEASIVGYLQGKDAIDESLSATIDSVYALHDCGRIMPVNKVEKSASDCLWHLYTKAQNLPLTSQYVNVGVSEVGNAINGSRPLGYEDSIRVLVAFIDDVNGLTSAPTHINVTPYYYNYNEGIGNIKISHNYAIQDSALTSEQRLKISYFIWQAEQLELKANAALEKSIEQNTLSFANSAIGEFVYDDIDSYWNSLRCLFKDDKEAEEFYRQKFDERFDVAQLQDAVQEEIYSYCVAINCSRILAVNEVLGYDENVNNLDIAQKTRLRKMIARMEGMQRAVEQVNAAGAKDAILTAAVAGVAFVTGGAAAPAAAGAAATTTSTLGSYIVTVASDWLAYIGMDKVYADLYKYVTGSELDSAEALEQLQKNLMGEMQSSMDEQKAEQGANYYKTLLDDNTRKYYQQLREDLGL